MKNTLCAQKYIPFIALAALLLMVLACGSNTRPLLVSPTVSSLPPTETPSPTATSAYTPTPTATPDPYIYLGGDWPYGVWGYIFNPERGARGHLRVYMGEQKSYIFEIIGAADCSSMPSGQGYLVRYPNGDEEWKDRQAMEYSELFVLEDELTDTLIDFNWRFYQCP